MIDKDNMIVFEDYLPFSIDELLEKIENNKPKKFNFDEFREKYTCKFFEMTDQEKAEVASLILNEIEKNENQLNQDFYEVE